MDIVSGLGNLATEALVVSGPCHYSPPGQVLPSQAIQHYCTLSNVKIILHGDETHTEQLAQSQSAV